MTSYPMISKCFGAPSGMSSTLHSVTSCSIAEANRVGALRICGSRGLSTQERREPIFRGVRGRGRGRGSGRDAEDDPIHAMDVHLRIHGQVLVRNRLPELAAMRHVAFLPGSEPVLDDRGQSDHLPDDRGPVSDLLDLVHGEEQEASEETGRREKGRKEVQLIIRRYDEPRWTKRGEECGREDDRDDAPDAEHPVSRCLHLDNNQDDSDDEQEERDRIDAESEADQREEEDDDAGNLRTVAWSGYPEDHEIDPEDQEERRNEGVGQHPEERDPTGRAEPHDLGACGIQREILVDGSIALNDHPTAARESSELLRTLCDEFRGASTLRLRRVEVEVVDDEG